MGVDNSSTSGDLDVVVDQSTETIDPENPHIGCWSGWRDGSLRRCLAECPVGPMLVVVRHIAQQRDLQLSSTSEQHPSSSSRPTVPTHRWAKAFAGGARIGDRRSRMPGRRGSQRRCW